MSARPGFRFFTVSSLLVSACSQAPQDPAPSTFNGEGGMTLAGDPRHPTPVSGGTGGGAGIPGAPADSGAGPSDADAGTADGGATASTAVSSVLTRVTWKVVAESPGSNNYANTAAAASRGKDAAVAYVETSYADQTSPTPSTVHAVLQRFDAAAERIGPLIVLGTDPDPSSALTLASDAKQYAACWNSAGEVHCVRVDDQGRVQESPLVLAGQNPTLVADSKGWAIGYTSGDQQLRLQRLSAAFEPSGKPVDLARSSNFQSQKAGPLLTPTPSGFALVGASLEDGHDCLLRLNADLQPVGTAIPLGRDFWTSGQLVASETRAAVSLSAPYGSYLLLLDTQQVTAELPIGGGGKTGMDHALLLAEGGIGAVWLAPDLGLLRRFFADGQDAAVGLENRIHPGSLLGMAEEGTGSYQQLLRVEDRTLVIARSWRYGVFSSGQGIRAASLTFP